MATVSAVRDAVKTRLATITGLHAYDVWPDTIQTPAACVLPISATALTSLGGNGSFFFEILVVVQESNLKRAQDSLDVLLDLSGATTSIVGAWWADRTMGGVVSDSILSGWRNYGDMTINNVTYLGAVFDLEAYVQF